ncbi:DNA cytosine methyltransferase [Fulvimarina manganoxydans]|uniref:DNA cytosine methyltransferase n=1 Tax=Fulvimarina manganoxydans TaxID=937218 RepID=UPI00111C439F|nr:DNA (cytosine-5-)-methyltransferase [Fulvimarina manganoxydans]
MFSTISLFSGIGGLDFGFEEAGFETRVALELDRFACRTMRSNRPSWNVMEGDIATMSSEDILANAGLAAGEPDMLIGGPPCQPFSKSSYWVRGDTLRLDDPRAETLAQYLRVLRDTRPKAFLLENVGGLAYEGKDEGLQLLLEGIRQVNEAVGTNYQPTWRVIKCVEYGVPQIRERVFLVGARDGRQFRFPEPTHASVGGKGDLFAEPREPVMTAWDAIGDLPEPNDLTGLKVGGKWGDLLPTIPEGENYLHHTPRGGGMPLFGWRTRYWSFLLKLSKRMPSWTIQAQPGSAIGPFHWNSRKLTFQELCRLQTFPDDLHMEFGRTEMQKMLGNAVPSLIAEILAREIRRQIFGDAARSPLRLMPTRKLPVPAPERLADVPAAYHDMVGDHAPHPGTGKGRGAQGLPTAFRTESRANRAST